MTKSINKAQNGFVAVVFEKETHFINPKELKIDGVSLERILESLGEAHEDIVKLNKLIDIEVGNLKKDVLKLSTNLLQQQTELNNHKKVYENIIRGYITR